MLRNIPVLFRGDTWQLEVDNVLSVDGPPLDLTGNKMWITLKERSLGTALQHMEVIPPGTDASSGKHTLVVPHSLTKDVQPGDYSYDIQWVDSFVVTTLFYGVVKVLADITQNVL